MRPVRFGRDPLTLPPDAVGDLGDVLQDAAALPAWVWRAKRAEAALRAVADAKTLGEARRAIGVAKADATRGRSYDYDKIVSVFNSTLATGATRKVAIERVAEECGFLDAADRARAIENVKSRLREPEIAPHLDSPRSVRARERHKARVLGELGLR